MSDRVEHAPMKTEAIVGCGRCFEQFYTAVIDDLPRVIACPACSMIMGLVGVNEQGGLRFVYLGDGWHSEPE